MPQPNDIRVDLADLEARLNEAQRTSESIDVQSLDIQVDRTTGPVERIWKEVASALRREQHRYQPKFRSKKTRSKKFACRIIGETPKWYKIVLWGELGHAQIKVVPKEEVKPR